MQLTILFVHPSKKGREAVCATVDVQVLIERLWIRYAQKRDLLGAEPTFEIESVEPVAPTKFVSGLITHDGWDAYERFPNACAYLLRIVCRRHFDSVKIVTKLQKVSQEELVA